MSYVNNYVPVSPPPIDPEHILSYGISEYDHNYCIPKAVRDLENEKIKLAPFIVSDAAHSYAPAGKKT